MTHIDTELALVMLEEFRRQCAIQEGAEEEYKGREFLEDEAVMGSSEKMIFFTKEMVSALTNSQKYMIDPFIVAKLDTNTIKCYDFPETSKDINKYTVRGYNKAGGASMVKAEEEALFGIAKASQGTDKKSLSDMVAG